jgi:hypothetical protein
VCLKRHRMTLTNRGNRFRAHVALSAVLLLLSMLEIELATVCIRAAWHHLGSYDVQLPLSAGPIFQWWLRLSLYPWPIFVALLSLVAGWSAFSLRGRSIDIVAAYVGLMLASTAALLLVLIMIVLPLGACC